MDLILESAVLDGLGLVTLSRRLRPIGQSPSCSRLRNGDLSRGSSWDGHDEERGEGRRLFLGSLSSVVAVSQWTKTETARCNRKEKADREECESWRRMTQN